MPGQSPDSSLFTDPDRLKPGEREPIRALNPLPLNGEALCSCSCGWFGPAGQRQGGACPACGSTTAKSPSKAVVHVYETLTKLLSDNSERLKGAQIDCISLRAMVDQSVQNCRTLQDVQTPLTAKAAAFDASMKLIGLPADTAPDVFPGFIQSILHDQLRYTMHRDVLRLDQAAWDAVQDFPQHKMSALDYDQAVDRQISRWRQIQQQAEMQRLALEKAEADQVEEATKQQDDPAHHGGQDQPGTEAA